MIHCPSHEWEAYIDAQDAGVAAEAHFLDSRREDILRVLCAVLGNPNVKGNLAEQTSAIAKFAINIVRQLEPPEL